METPAVIASAVLIASFVLLFCGVRFHRMTASFRFYGRMSLPNYISQSVAGALPTFRSGFIWRRGAVIRSAC